MVNLSALIHACHFAATLLAAGWCFFLWVIAHPAFARAGAREDQAEFHHRSRRIVGMVLVLALISGALWLVATSASMSDRAFSGALDPAILRVVLTQTRFGLVWLLRFGLCALFLIVVMAERRAGRRLDGIGTALGGILVATLAWAGHGAADEDIAGRIHLGADLAHLLAAAAWLGGLPPLAFLLARAYRGPAPHRIATATTATQRFSVLGMFAVATLILSGLVNSWFLIGTVPALIGTTYGQMLMLKLVLFLAMVGLAAFNQFRLTPRLAAASAPSAARSLCRNAGLEAALGAGVLAAVGALTIAVPAAHDTITWPLPVTWSLQAVAGSPMREAAAVAAALLAVVGIALAALAALGGRGGRGIAAGSTIAAASVAIGGVALSEPAVPTVYLNSPLPYSAATVAAGAQTFAEQCVACHGPHGYGDGPAAANLPVKPADLARQHVGHHTDGTLFWWISHGKGENAMPAFVDLLDAKQRWEAIAFLHAQFDAETAQRLGPRIDPALRIAAPDFAFERGSGQWTLGMLRQAWSVLLVFYTLPASEPRIETLAQAAQRLDFRGLRIVAVPLGGAGAKGPIFSPSDPDLIAAYSLFRNRDGGEEATPPDHLEYLIDYWGYVRARFTATEAATPEQLVAMLEAVRREPAPPPVGQAGHVH